MGVLSTWGAVAGGAGAAQDYLVDERKQGYKQEQVAAESARQERLLKLKERYRKGAAEQEQGFRTSEREAEQEFMSGQAEDKRTSQKELTEMELSSREGIAADKSAADLEREKIRSATNIKQKEITAGKTGKPKYKSVKLKVSEMTDEGFSEKDMPVTYDETTGQYYENRAGKLIPYDLESNIPPVEKVLFQNPQAKEAYLKSPRGKKYGLPKWYELMYGQQ